MESKLHLLGLHFCLALSEKVGGGLSGKLDNNQQSVLVNWLVLAVQPSSGKASPCMFRESVKIVALKQPGGCLRSRGVFRMGGIAGYREETWNRITTSFP